MADDPCCSPRREARDATPRLSPPAGGGGAAEDLVPIPGGSFTMGTDAPSRFPADGEGPERAVRLGGFSIGRTAVSNAQFGEFVEATGHVTDAERYGWSFVFHLLLPDDFPPTRGVAEAPWWRQVEGADWAHPFGPHSGIDDLRDHPVVHASWRDADAFCAWAGGRLPTEAEWERAARGGLERRRYPWGDEFAPGGRKMCRIFEGTFPTVCTSPGGPGTVPTDAHPPNGFGLHNAAGNVWEWCDDWFSAHHGADSSWDPRGPADGTNRVMKGGSYLCHDSYCNRYRVAARSASTPDSSTGNLGFRIVVPSESGGPPPPQRAL